MEKVNVCGVNIVRVRLCDERKNTYQEVWAANYYSLILIN